MIKLLGAVIILSSVVLLSIIPIWNCKQRTLLLKDLLHDLRYIRTELHSNLCSVPSLIDLLSKKGSAGTIEFYQVIQEKIDAYGVAAFSDNWNIGIGERFICLTNEERTVLCRLGNILGQFLLDEQLTELSHIIECFEKFLSNEKDKYLEKTKLYLGTGVSFGLIVVILLL